MLERLSEESETGMDLEIYHLNSHVLHGSVHGEVNVKIEKCEQFDVEGYGCFRAIEQKGVGKPQL